MKGLIPTPNPTGGLEDESVTFPANPFRLVTVIVENPIEPAVMVRFDGDALNAKSGVAAGITFAKLDAGTVKAMLAVRRMRETSMTGNLNKTTGDLCFA